jgi:succinylglutamate desuccinylase
MREDKIYKNFDKISKDELLAFDKYGEIRSKEDGMILMPLYQKQGNDGFFIIKEC